MYIAHTDYSSLYNAKRARGAANQTQYAAQSVALQQKGFSLQQSGITLNQDYADEQRKTQNWNVAIQGAKLLVTTGQEIYGIYTEAQTQKAKIEMVNSAMPAIAQRQMEAVANGEIEISVDANGKQSVQMSPEFDAYVQEQITSVSENYNVGSVKNYIEGTLGKYAMTQKLEALDGIARQQLANIEVSDEQGMNAAVEQGIATRSRAPIDAQLKSMAGRRNSTDMSIRDTNATLQWEDGITKSNIKAVLHEGGLPEAEDHINSLPISDARKSAYTSYARSTAESDVISAGAKVQETADEIQRNGGTMYDIQDAIKGDASIPKYYREKFSNQYKFAGDMDEMKAQVHTSGRAAALEYVNSPERKYTRDELVQARANVDLAEKNELITIKNKYSDMAKKIVEEGSTPTSLYKAIDEGEDDPAHKEAATQAVESVHSTWLSDSFETRYGTEKYDLKSLQLHKDEIQTDVAGKGAGAYDHFPEVAVNHLDRLDREIAGFGTGSEASANAKATKYFNTQYTALYNGDTTVKKVLADIADPTTKFYGELMESTKVQPFMKDMIDFNITDGPLAPMAKGLLDDYEVMLKSAKGIDPADINRLRAGLGIQINNYLDGNLNIDEGKLQKIADDYKNQTMGKVFAIIDASYSGQPGDMKTEKQEWKLQQSLDTENMNYTVDLQGNVDIPPTTQAAMQQHIEVMQNKLSTMLGIPHTEASLSGYASLGDPTKINVGFTEGEDGKVAANPVYVVTRNGVPAKYMFAASEDKGQYDLYEIIDGNLSPVTVLKAEEAPALVPEGIYKQNESLMKGLPNVPTPEKEEIEEEDKPVIDQLRNKYPGLGF